MHIEGKNLPQGKYLFQRYMTYNGEKVKVNTYKIERTTEDYRFYDSENKMEEEVRRIELKKGNIALIWTQGSRLGLLYTIEVDPGEEENKSTEE